LEGPIDFDDLAAAAGQRMAQDLPISVSELTEGFLEGARRGGTPVAHGAALPHMRSDMLDRPQVLFARVVGGVRFSLSSSDSDPSSEEVVRAVFFLASPEHDPGQHLRILAQVARGVDQPAFMPEWLAAESDEELKEALFRNERMLIIKLVEGRSGSDLIGLELRDISLPEGTLIAMLRRGDELVFPRGNTALQAGDRLTVIGRPEGVETLRERYGVAARADG
jgi:mannitol/fructose-specific phosphotransferase system IIA component (Ntr-type)